MRTSVGAFDCGEESCIRCLGCFTGCLGKVNCHFTCVQFGLARLPCGLGLPCHFRCVQFGLGGCCGLGRFGARLPCGLGRRCAVGSEQFQSLFHCRFFQVIFRLPCPLGRRCAVGGEEFLSFLPLLVVLSCCPFAFFLVFFHLGLQVLALGVCT